jgi:hypothetical protein
LHGFNLAKERLMKRFVTSDIRVKALFLDGENIADEAITLGNGLVTASGGYLVAQVGGTQKTLGADQVLFVDGSGHLDVMEKPLFLSLFQEYQLPTYSFGQAKDMVVAGKKMTRKAWGDGVYLTLISPAVEMLPFVGIFSGVLKPYVPGSDTMLADDFVEVE